MVFRTRGSSGRSPRRAQLPVGAEEVLQHILETSLTADPGRVGFLQRQQQQQSPPLFLETALLPWCLSGCLHGGCGGGGRGDCGGGGF